MKISEVTTGQIAEYLRLDASDGLPEELEAIRTAAVEYMKSYTGMSNEELDEHEEFYVVLMVLAQDMYDNRVLAVNNTNVNRVVESILDMHRKNLL